MNLVALSFTCAATLGIDALNESASDKGSMSSSIICCLSSGVSTSPITTLDNISLQRYDEELERFNEIIHQL